MASEMTWIGIDFGTCSSRATFIQHSLTQPLYFEPTLPQLPSSVFVENDGTIAPGRQAENQRHIDPSRYQSEFKRDLGTTIPYRLGDQDLLPEDLIAIVLNHIRQKAVEHLKRSVDGSVVSVPATYSDYNRRLMENAALRAGFIEVQLLDEPIAAVTYYSAPVPRGMGQSLNNGEIVMVYDLGGDTFDIALIQKHRDACRFVGSPGSLKGCGGIAFDQAIYEYMRAQCPEQHLYDLQNTDPRALRVRLITQERARYFKHQLSDFESYQDIAPWSLTDDYRLTREELNNLISPLVDQTIAQSLAVIEKARIKIDQVSQVLLIGGSCRIPYVTERVEQALGRPVVRVDDLELAIARGAILHARATVASDEHQSQLTKLEQQILGALQRRLVFLLVGQTGVGKSSTINALLGESLAPVGRFRPKTMEVKPYHTRINNILCTVIDTPGLCDELPEKGHDLKYLRQMTDAIKEVDCVWFVTRLDFTRVTSDEKRGIKLISEAFGKEIWEHAVIVFTWANSVDSGEFAEALQERTELIREEIAKYAKSERIAQSVPAVAVDNKAEMTHDGEYWLGNLYIQVLERIEANKARALVVTTIDRIEVVSDSEVRKTQGSQPRTDEPYVSSRTSGRSSSTTSSNGSSAQRSPESHTPVAGTGGSSHPSTSGSASPPAKPPIKIPEKKMTVVQRLFTGVGNIARSIGNGIKKFLGWK